MKSPAKTRYNTLTVYSSGVRLLAPPLDKPECWQTLQQECNAHHYNKQEPEKHLLWVCGQHWKASQKHSVSSSPFMDEREPVHHTGISILLLLYWLFGIQPKEEMPWSGVVCSNWFNQHSTAWWVFFFCSRGRRILQEGQDEPTICHLGTDTWTSSTRKGNTPSSGDTLLILPCSQNCCGAVSAWECGEKAQQSKREPEGRTRIEDRLNTPDKRKGACFESDLAMDEGETIGLTTSINIPPASSQLLN